MADFWQKKSYSQEDIESTKKLLELLRPMEEEKINSDENGFATIHTYALENNLDLELFLASGLNVNELSRKEKISALQLAVAAGHQDMVRLLIAYGADMYIQESDILPPLFTAIQKNDLDMVKILIECGVDPQRKCRIANTKASALAFTLVHNKEEIFTFLRSVNKNVSNIPNHELKNDSQTLLLEGEQTKKGKTKMQYWIGCWKKYATFSGRASRKEYWMFFLFNFLFAFGLQIVDAVLGTEGVLGGLYALAALLPSWAVVTRRMHDIGKSGWWWLIAFIPLVGAIVLLVFMCKDSEPGDNAYGPNPKGV
jgi:uncharacterized membrane protein YhaH (DUF805 family)